MFLGIKLLVSAPVAHPPVAAALHVGSRSPTGAGSVGSAPQRFPWPAQSGCTSLGHRRVRLCRWSQRPNERSQNPPGFLPGWSGWWLTGWPTPLKNIWLRQYDDIPNIWKVIKLFKKIQGSKLPTSCSSADRPQAVPICQVQAFHRPPTRIGRKSKEFTRLARNRHQRRRCVGCRQGQSIRGEATESPLRSLSCLSPQLHRSGTLKNLQTPGIGWKYLKMVAREWHGSPIFTCSQDLGISRLGWICSLPAKLRGGQTPQQRSQTPCSSSRKAKSRLADSHQPRGK